MRKIIGIYKIESPTGKIYIGQSNDIYRRWKTYHIYKCNSQTFLYNSFIKHGVDTHTFQIVHELPYDVNLEILNEYELFYYELYLNCSCEMLNLIVPGNYRRHHESTRIRMSKLRKEYVDANIKGKILEEIYGIDKAKEIKNLLSKASKGKKKTLEHCQNISKGSKGKKKSEEHNIKNRLARKGKSWVEQYGEEKAKRLKLQVSQRQKGRIVKGETRRKISLRMKKQWKENPNWNKNK